MKGYNDFTPEMEATQEVKQEADFYRAYKNFARQLVKQN